MLSKQTGNNLIPVALINRTSDKHITVPTSNQLIWQKGYRQSAVLTSTAPYIATGLRTRLFLEEARWIGLETDPFVITTANSMEGGARRPWSSFSAGKGGPR